MSSELALLIEEIRREYQAAQQKRWVLPTPPEEIDYQNYPHLQWLPLSGEEPPLPKEETIANVRKGLEQNIRDYLSTEREKPSLLLVRVAPGVGKTHAGVQLAQDRAKAGDTVLWAAQRHDMFEQLSLIPGFDPVFWQHWRPMQLEPVETCRYTPYQHVWVKKGYPSFTLCKSLCTFDNHLSHCPFRRQAHATQPICFVMHQHLVLGIGRTAWDWGIIDELPIQAFLSTRHIPRKEMAIQGGKPEVRDFAVRLMDLASGLGEHETLSGKPLMDAIKEVLRQVWYALEKFEDALPFVPRVFQPEDVAKAPYFYLPDLLKILSREWAVYQQGWEKWAERVFLTKDGLDLVGRAREWDSLPDKLICFDATASPTVYEFIFPEREILSYAPVTQGQGKVFQITGRLYGQGTLQAETDCGEVGDLIAAIEKLRDIHHYKSIGVVCHKSATARFAECFGESAVLHFYGQRGTNSLQDVDALFICGTPSPSPQSLLTQATALDDQRMEPFYPQYSYQKLPYLIRPEAAHVAGHPLHYPVRLIGGYHGQPALQGLLSQHREYEIVQALHRSRLSIRSTDVWVFSPIPLPDIILDGIFPYPPIAPQGIGWKHWLKMEPWLLREWSIGNGVGRHELASFAQISPKSVYNQGWLPAIQEHMRDERGNPLWDWEDDPLFIGKRGPRIQRLKPVSR
jgi:hypothetical protein